MDIRPVGMEVCEGYTFRGIEDGDVEWMLASLVQSATVSISEDVLTRTDPMSLADRMESITDRLINEQGDETTFIVATRGSERAGIVWVGHMTDTFSGEEVGIIWNLFVEPAHRRRGLARALMSAAEQWASDVGYRSIVLNVSSGNEAALRLYERVGYEVDNIHMRKTIG